MIVSSRQPSRHLVLVMISYILVLQSIYSKYILLSVKGDIEIKRTPNGQSIQDVVQNIPFDADFPNETSSHPSRFKVNQNVLDTARVVHIADLNKRKDYAGIH